MIGLNLHRQAPKVTVHRGEVSAAFLAEVSGLGSARTRVIERRTHVVGGQRVTPGDVVRVEDADGRVSQGAVARTVTMKIADTGRDLNAFRRMLYDAARSEGMPHEEAVFRLFPEGKITV